MHNGSINKIEYLKVTFIAKNGLIDYEIMQLVLASNSKWPIINRPEYSGIKYWKKGKRLKMFRAMTLIKKFHFFSYNKRK